MEHAEHRTLRENGIDLALSALVACLFLLIFSYCTSPLTSYQGADSSYFILVGRGMTAGMLPFRDFFDMKGPYLYAIEYIGQLLAPGRTGAFIMQCLHLTVSLWIVGRIYGMYWNGGTGKTALRYRWIYTLPLLYVALVTFEGGNLTEEFSLPWLLAAVYFLLRYWKRSDRSQTYEHPAWIGFFYGAAFGFFALIRITNAAMICAVVLSIVILLIQKRLFRNLLMNAVAFVSGCVVAFLPPCIFFAAHGLLGEMLNQVFLFGAKYSAEHSFFDSVLFILTRPRRLIYAGTYAFMLIVPAVYRIRNARYWILAGSVLVLHLVATAAGNGYMHYFTLAIPALVLAIAIFLEQQAKDGCQTAKKWNKAKLTVWILIGLLACAQGKYVIESSAEAVEGMSSAHMQTEKQAEIADIMAMIPETDYDSVYAYCLAPCSVWYAESGLLPCYRYLDWQAHYCALEPSIKQDIAAYFQDRGAKWIVTPANVDVQSLINGDVLDENYREVRKYKLYRLMTVR